MEMPIIFKSNNCYESSNNLLHFISYSSLYLTMLENAAFARHVISLESVIC